ncbi:hypothetical protein MAPG_08817 [Magnaporthiopsis poae ATCC 64411]|uniref:LysM domain-containing protein n=1 Tax=Magnaporthiopsis poae (strain ATCC 64411 / 73-15) TaxID=644358 RepID=A0A0C4E8B7_MAGP6|nr:hypothetical protein MAPG_08817 [Magnaporthiopsis poae ATCC 64411]
MIDDDCQSLLEPYCAPTPTPRRQPLPSRTFPKCCMPSYMMNPNFHYCIRPPWRCESPLVSLPEMVRAVEQPVETHLPWESTHAVSRDLCGTIAEQYGISLEQFYQRNPRWNPAVGQDCQSLWAGYYYCVGTVDKPAPSDPPKPTTTASPPPMGCSNSNPSPTQPGSICECKRWHLV